MKGGQELSNYIVQDNGNIITEWVCRGVKEKIENLGSFFITLGFVRNQKLVGGLIYHGISGNELFWTIYTDSPMWCTRKILRFCFRFAFENLKVRRINLLISRSNVQSLSFCTRLGFQIEGIKRQARDNGEDAFYLGMLKSECKFINKGERK